MRTTWIATGALALLLLGGCKQRTTTQTVETPTTIMALVHFASGADIVLSMSWDVWKHGHPPIDLIDHL